MNELIKGHNEPLKEYKSNLNITCELWSKVLYQVVIQKHLGDQEAKVRAQKPNDGWTDTICSLCHNSFHLLAQKPNLEKFSIYSNKFFHNFHLSKSSFTCPGLRPSR